MEDVNKIQTELLWMETTSEMKTYWTGLMADWAFQKKKKISDFQDIVIETKIKQSTKIFQRPSLNN